MRLVALVDHDDLAREGGSGKERVDCVGDELRPVACAHDHRRLQRPGLGH
jgi:hypothetical protein